MSGNAKLNAIGKIFSVSIKSLGPPIAIDDSHLDFFGWLALCCV